MKRYFINFCLILSLLLFSDTAFAGNDPDPSGGGDDTTSIIVDVMCNAINQISGPIGQTIAIVIVISLAIMLFLGKVTWGVAIAVAVGVGVLFGAKDLVNTITKGISTTTKADICADK